MDCEQEQNRDQEKNWEKVYEKERRLREWKLKQDEFWERKTHPDRLAQIQRQRREQNYPRDEPHQIERDQMEGRWCSTHRGIFSHGYGYCSMKESVDDGMACSA